MLYLIYYQGIGTSMTVIYKTYSIIFSLPSCTPILNWHRSPARSTIFYARCCSHCPSQRNVEKTKAKRILPWNKWCKFLQSIGVRNDFFLDGFSRCQRKIVLVAFTQDVRQSKFLQGQKKRLVAATVRDTILYLSQASKSDLRDDPRRYPDGSF